MEQTQFYALSQWSIDDRIRMEDFNADNAKIDAALRSLEVRTAAKADASALSTLQTALTKEAADRDAAITALEDRATARRLKTVHPTADATTFTVDLSDITWTKYREVIVMARLYGNSTASVYLDGAGIAGSLSASNIAITVLYPMYATSSLITGMHMGLGGFFLNSSYAFSRLTAIRYVGSNNITANSTVFVYGLK